MEYEWRENSPGCQLRRKDYISSQDVFVSGEFVLTRASCTATYSKTHTHPWALEKGAGRPGLICLLPAFPSGHASLQPEFRIELQMKHDTGRRSKVILRKLVVLELEEVGSKEFQLERPESEVACEVVVEPTAKCPSKVRLLAAGVKHPRVCARYAIQDLRKGSGASHRKNETRAKKVGGLRAP